MCWVGLGRLEEMKAYCEEEEVCRRHFFRMKFSSSSSSSVKNSIRDGRLHSTRCSKMCDNCKQDREDVVVPQQPLAKKTRLQRNEASSSSNASANPNGRAALVSARQLLTSNSHTKLEIDNDDEEEDEEEWLETRRKPSLPFRKAERGLAMEDIDHDDDLGISRKPLAPSVAIQATEPSKLTFVKATALLATTAPRPRTQLIGAQSTSSLSSSSSTGLARNGSSALSAVRNVGRSLGAKRFPPLVPSSQFKSAHAPAQPSAVIDLIDDD